MLGEVTEEADTRIGSMIEARKIASMLLNHAATIVRAGVSTSFLDKKLQNVSIANSLCTKKVSLSVNGCVLNGTPNFSKLKAKDIVTVDVTVDLDGYSATCAKTFLCAIAAKSRKLIEVCEKALEKAIAQCRVGFKFENLFQIIREHASSENFTALDGLDFQFSAIDGVDNLYEEKMLEGHAFAIVAAVVKGNSKRVVTKGAEIHTGDDCKAAVTKHTILITRKNVEILTCPISEDD